MPRSNTDEGISHMSAAQQVWGKRGIVLLTIGLALLMIVFELDNSTVNPLQNYSMSEFGALSSLGMLYTASTIVFAIVKVPIAKLSDIIGRGHTLAIVLFFYVMPYILMSSATGLPLYVTGKILSKIGQSGANVISTVVISDITAPRQRGLALNLSYFPFLITPWISGYIVDSIVNGIGWRWGVRLFVIIVPAGSCLLIGTLIHYQHKAKRLDLIPPTKTTIRSFCSDIDIGGLLLFVVGFGLLLCPISVAGSLPDGWSTPWIPTILVVGLLVLVALFIYEKFVAENPLLPTFYFRDATIMLSMLLIAIDYLGYSATHTYIYSWGTISYNMSPRLATFFSLSAGVTQALFGIFAGWVMLITGRYKWLTVGGAVFRLLGYSLMYRLRGQHNSLIELFTQQILQGIGTGIIHAVLVVSPQIVVPHPQIAQVLSLTLSMAFLGRGIGSAIAGGIYTSTMRPALLSYLGANATTQIVENLYNSITKGVPAWGTVQRDAISHAYTEVTKNFSHVGVGTSILAIIMSLLLPNLMLSNNSSNNDHPLRHGTA